MVKWLAGIAGSIITAVAIWWLTHPGGALNPQKPQNNSRQKGSSGSLSAAPPAVRTHISGKVLNTDNNQPLANVEVGYFRYTQDPNAYAHGVRAHLATTGPDGSFEADCSAVEAEDFPLRLTLSRTGWGGGGTLEMNEYIKRGETKRGINLYVSDNLMKKLPR